ncbi:TIGR03808 family TAT-translocated repetitive protein [Rhizobium halophytocola]|uniref:Secreted repeat protein (TIGR03808 family) n=1 Tax=Rhizobium halophytocola TaxID=735519 RepID=A0ABS4DX19_9HYPH|nr:TIGR03808 family TAT-translocated repetitive protein [Rhizobium halophytocola]MBP1850227.1 putative secreted repeat protein (TIGR03808 family) [Rhizobium halophytocola]
MIGRREILRRGLAGGLAGAFAPLPFAGRAMAQSLDETPLRGAIDAARAGLSPRSTDDQSVALQAIVERAAKAQLPIFLPPGRYRISRLDLPDGARLTGIAGASRIVLEGGYGIRADRAGRIGLSNLVIDGGGHRLDSQALGLVYLANIKEAILDTIEVTGSAGHAIALERCGGSLRRSNLNHAGDAGLYAVECERLSIEDNVVGDCGNGGILVHRWEKSDDGAIVRGNRVLRIAAKKGGTGEYGNGINVFRADNVMVAGNHVSDCAFSAIRANSASNVAITGNQCLASGEAAIFVEFDFQGAVVSDNLVDGAANGIVLGNFNEGGRLSTVSGNLIRNLRLDGPYADDEAGFGFGIAVEADALVSGNVIEDAPRYGMMVGWGEYLRDIVVSGNIVRKAPIGIYVSVAEGAGEAVFTGNLFAQTPKGAIVGFRWNEKVTGDLLQDASLYRQFTFSANRSRLSAE